MKMSYVSKNDRTVELAHQIFALCQRSFTGKSPWTKQQFLDDFLSPFSHYLLVVTPENQLVGFINGHLIFDEFELFLLAVDPIMQKQGIASKMFGELERFLKDQGVSQILLEVRESNQQAIALYKKQGFEAYHIRKGYYQDPIESAYMLRKEVGKK